MGTAVIERIFRCRSKKSEVRRTVPLVIAKARVVGGLAQRLTGDLPELVPLRFIGSIGDLIAGLNDEIGFELTIRSRTDACTAGWVRLSPYAANLNG